MAEAEVDEASEVEGCGSQCEAEPVGVDTDEPHAAAAVRNEPSDGALNQGSVLAVAVGEVVVAAPTGPVCGEKLVVTSNCEDLPRRSCRATLAKRAASTLRSKGCGAAGGDVGAGPVGAGHGSGLIVDGEVISAELIGAQIRVGVQRPGFDHWDVSAASIAASDPPEPYAESARISVPAGSPATRAIPVGPSPSLAGVRSQLVMMPVSGSTATWAL